jgi:hypothetical protein
VVLSVSRELVAVQWDFGCKWVAEMQAQVGATPSVPNRHFHLDLCCHEKEDKELDSNHVVVEQDLLLLVGMELESAR